ncbi:MAG: DUF1564 domain-containing protein [Leptospiraceae bacterium]|nr:DUF1564 domain-containing protein [Leptospiraceae bacterium]
MTLLLCMATYFIGNEHKQFISLKEHEKTVSSLRIPVILRRTFEEGIRENGSPARFLAYLLKKYRFLFYVNGIPFSKKVKTEYQERGTEVFTKSFRPELRDWIELGIWASALNYSKCKLFVILLWFEYEREFSVNERAFLYVAYVVTTPHNFRVPRLTKVLRKGRSVLERGITFYESPS